LQRSHCLFFCKSYALSSVKAKPFLLYKLRPFFCKNYALLLSLCPSGLSLFSYRCHSALSSVKKIDLSAVTLPFCVAPLHFSCFPLPFLFIPSLSMAPTIVCSFLQSLLVVSPSRLPFNGWLAVGLTLQWLAGIRPYPSMAGWQLALPFNGWLAVPFNGWLAVPFNG
jgi:hypothetical protein